MPTTSIQRILKDLNSLSDKLGLSCDRLRTVVLGLIMSGLHLSQVLGRKFGLSCDRFYILA